MINSPSPRMALQLGSAHGAICRSCLYLARRSSPAFLPSNTPRWHSTHNPAAPRRQRPDVYKPKRQASSLGTQSKNNVEDVSFISRIGQSTSPEERVLLKPNNLFHSFSHSPSPDIRRRAAFMRQHAYCPHPSHQRTRQVTAPNDPENRKPDAGTAAAPPAHVKFECPDCGIPAYCCEEHWMDDYEAHLEICPTLKEINEDDHDLRSGRFFREFEYPGPQRSEEFVINMSNWDTFMYTRDFAAVDDPRSMRQATRGLTYPMTLASTLHELSPYSVRSGGRLTPEGLRSFAGKSCRFGYRNTHSRFASAAIYASSTSLWW